MHGAFGRRGRMRRRRPTGNMKERRARGPSPGPHWLETNCEREVRLSFAEWFAPRAQEQNPLKRVDREIQKTNQMRSANHR